MFLQFVCFYSLYKVTPFRDQSVVVRPVSLPPGHSSPGTDSQARPLQGGFLEALLPPPERMWLPSHQDTQGEGTSATETSLRALCF